MESNCYKFSKKNTRLLSDHASLLPIPIFDQEEELRNEDFDCGICREIVFLPHSLPCGHDFCQQCISNWKKKNSSCPKCRKEFTSISLNSESTAKLDDQKVSCVDCDFKGSAKEFQQHQIKCPNSSQLTACPNDGCGVAGPAMKLDDHLKRCYFQKVPCKKCGKTVTKIHQKLHRIQECPETTTCCDKCKSIFVRKTGHECTPK
jgi:hypothetical protein